MTENPQISAVLEYIEARERELGEQAGQLRSRVEELTARLSELDAESENLRITRKTLLAIPAPAPADETPRPDVPDHPAYQQILTALTEAGRCRGRRRSRPTRGCRCAARAGSRCTSAAPRRGR
ncbi:MULTISPECIES: hypothetical protein [unclassified Streptomyces]|uniref:hypothetical protein n=1 Tax=unclassified Streptomyces TaxID=2593676 RepID=UPI00224E7B61|nr:MULTISPECIES: hypothetical protein [unclassified Streptomyces]WSP53209.1 hypothetical protein OG306_01305 [Streptomyces sp. NBC_01241]MCX4792118.1 hypothetical protein [Streptomyces sp. NBC_01221]MCX4799973.1 hypothetical protein [Streptomyces sp. NBC_01242]WSJ40634.1 hypothetical protein OG772_34930 [Streptomyces sp. NBC_01321]WSP66955.1 hypothetical protein OG466_37675 [Streptomyces sp. NBC_01240]